MTALIVLIFLASAYFIPSSMLTRPEYFLVAAIAGWSTLNRGLVCHRIIRKELFLLAILMALASITLMVQIFAAGTFIARDAQILLRYFIYMLTLIAGVHAGLSIRRTTLLSLALWSLVGASIALSFAQYFNLMNINKIMASIYGERIDLLVEEASWRRIVGTLSNPNYWGMLLGIGFVIIGHHAIARRNIILLPFVVLLFVGIIMTGSRGSLISSVAGLLFGTLLSQYRSPSGASRRSMLTTVLIAVIGAALFYGYKLFTQQYYADQNRFSVDNTYTLNLRFQYWGQFLTKLLENPYQILIGRGPSKATEAVWGDNMYLLILRDFGLPALMVYLGLLFVFLRQLQRHARALPPKAAVLPAAATSVLIMFAIFDLAADAWFYVRVSMPLLFGYGFVLARARARIRDAKM